MTKVNSHGEIECCCGGLLYPELGFHGFNTGEYLCDSCDVRYEEWTPDNFRRVMVAK